MKVREPLQLSLWMLGVLLFTAGSTTTASDIPQAGTTSPVLVELFTSEGCSSCPPADALLQQLDQSQSAAPLIVLSEHVDYWDRLGWKDPYSSSFFTDRQSSYASHFGLKSSYTPEMVVDGATEFLGSDSRLAEQAIQKAGQNPKVTVQISSLSWESPGVLHAHVEAGPLPESSPARKADVYLIGALNHAESEVVRGENQGRHLAYVAVVLAFNKIGSVERGKSFAGDVRMKLDARQDLLNLRVIGLVQASGPGSVLGAVQERLAK